MNIISPHFWQRVAILGFALLFHFNLAHAETAYLVSYNQKNLYLFDTATSKLTSTIPLNSSEGISIVINPSGTRAYISQTAGGISIVDINSNLPIQKIEGYYEGGLIMNPQGTRLYAASRTTLNVIDTTNNNIIKSIDMSSLGELMFGLSMNSAGTKLYTPFLFGAGSSGNFFNIGIVDTVNSTFSSIDSCCDSAISTVLSPDNTRLYIVDNIGFVSVFNTATNAKIAKIPVSGNWGIKVNKQGTKIYVAGNPISVINTATNTVSNTISANASANLAFNASGNRLYAVGGDTVSIIDPATDTVLSSTTIGTNLNLIDVGLAPVSILSVQKAGSGTGAITGNEMNCGATCTRAYADNSTVTLTATADAGSAFTGWSGDCSGTTSSVSLTMNQAKNCTATFNKTHRLTVTKLGAGTIEGWAILSGLSFTSRSGDVSIVDIVEGQSVAIGLQLTKPTQGTVFGGWGGDCSSSTSSQTCNLKMDAPKNVTVTYNKNELTIQKSGDGSGVVGSPTAGINSTSLDCGASCSTVFAAGTSVSLTPTPNADSYFGGWNDPSCNTAITMNAPKTCIATFLKKPVLTVNKIGNGIVKGIGVDCGADCSESYSSKTATVALTATADVGYIFSNWSGNCSGNSNSCTLTMDSDKTATANFTACTYNLSNSSANVPAKTNNGSFVASSNCALETAKSDASWLTLSQTNGTISYTVSTNLSISERTGNISLNGQTFKVVQAANQKPVANFTATPNSGNAPLTVKVDASSSTDPEDSPLEYQWQTSNTQAAVGKTAQFVFDKEGSYTITLTIKDNTGQTHSQTQNVLGSRCTYSLSSTVSPLLKAIGENGNFAVKTQTNCDWNATISQSWVKVSSNTGKVDLNGNATISYNVDPNPNSTERNATITVNNQQFTVNQAGNKPPISSFTMTPISGKLPLTIDVDASTSKDEDGSIVEYQWQTSNGQVATGKTAQFVPNQTGAFTVTLMVKDNMGLTHSSSRAIDSSCEYTLSANSASYSGIANSGSFNMNTNLATCAWQATPNVDWISLIKNNGTGTSAIDYKVAANPCTTTREATIVIGNKTFAISQSGSNPLPPIATFSATPTLGAIPTVITLNAADSQVQSCGNIVSYDWLITKENSQTTFSAQGKNTQLTLEEEGLYFVTLTIKDNGQTTVSDPKSIVIEKHLSFNAYRCAISDFNGFAGCQINTEKKPFYQIGNKLKVTLDSKIATNRFERLDLWVAIQLPDGQFLFRTPFAFSPFRFYQPPQYNGEAFMPNVEFANREDNVLEFDVPPHFSGKYTFYALYVALGMNPLLDSSSWKSNLAIKEITLE